MKENIRSYTVSQANSYIKSLFTRDPFLNSIAVRGEISNCKYHYSGHVYFTLKDAASSMSCVMFSQYVNNLDFKLYDGLQVTVTGTVNVYEKNGSYQLYIKNVIPDGAGALYERYELLKKKLDDEGLFLASHKVSIPHFALTVGIVTAPTGAVLQDIRNVSMRRNPYVKLVLSPSPVQGAGAGTKLAEALKKLDNYGCDVIIIGRGGGSIEDLWPFNEEIVARAVYGCRTPVISAVGHETDFTIADFVSDLRAPTPSAAAELAVFDIREFDAGMVDLHSSLTGAVMRKIQNCKDRSEAYAVQLGFLSPKALLKAKREELEAKKRLLVSKTALQKKIQESRNHLEQLKETMHFSYGKKLYACKTRLQYEAGLLEAHSPTARIAAGFAFVADDRGCGIHSVSDVKTGDEVNVTLKDGSFSAEIVNVYKNR